MQVTRDIVIDLMPLYQSGEASADTRAAIEEFLRHEPGLKRLVEEDDKNIPAIDATGRARAAHRRPHPRRHPAPRLDSGPGAVVHAPAIQLRVSRRQGDVLHAARRARLGRTLCRRRCAVAVVRATDSFAAHGWTLKTAGSRFAGSRGNHPAVSKQQPGRRPDLRAGWGPARAGGGGAPPATE